MKTVELQGTPRTQVGKAAMKKIRRAGNVPAVVYGKGEPMSVEVDFMAVHKMLHSPDTYLVNLAVDGKVTPAIVRDAQFHPVNDRVLHIDFLRVSDNEPVNVELPVQLVGTAKGVLAGGRLVPMLRKIKVRGLVNDLPDKVSIDISHLDLGKTIRAGDVQFEGITITSPASTGIAIIEIPRAVRQAEEAGKK